MNHLLEEARDFADKATAGFVLKLADMTVRQEEIAQQRSVR